MNFVTFDELNDCIYKNMKKIPRDIDLVIGIPRSGSLVANLIALYLNLPFMDIDSFLDGKNIRVGNTRKCEGWIKSSKDAKKALIVDDSITSGKAIKQVKDRIKESEITSEVVYLAVYALETNFYLVNLFFEICHQPRMFEWNYMHHWGLEYTCMDIDGVLCDDPTYIQNDDGKRYEEFLINAEPKFIPTKKIGYLVTCRLEKYRGLTQQWLEKHHIEYKQLIMLDNIEAEERKTNFNHGKFKANFYKTTNCFLFIESDYTQAIEIVQASNKQVFCVDKRKLITPDNLTAHLKILNNDFKITTKRVIKRLLKKV